MFQHHVSEPTITPLVCWLFFRPLECLKYDMAASLGIPPIIKFKAHSPQPVKVSHDNNLA